MILMPDDRPDYYSSSHDFFVRLAQFEDMPWDGQPRTSPGSRRRQNRTVGCKAKADFFMWCTAWMLTPPRAACPHLVGEPGKHLCRREHRRVRVGAARAGWIQRRAPYDVRRPRPRNRALRQHSDPSDRASVWMAGEAAEAGAPVRRAMGQGGNYVPVHYFPLATPIPSTT